MVFLLERTEVYLENGMIYRGSVLILQPVLDMALSVGKCRSHIQNRLLN